MKKTKKYEEGGKTILDRSKGKLVSKSEYAASRAKPAAKAPSSVLDRDRMGMTPAAPPKPKPKPEAPARKSPITANFTKTGEQFKPNPLKRTGLTPKQKAGIDKAAGDLRKSFIKEGVDKAASDLMAKSGAKPKPAAKSEYKTYAKNSAKAAEFRRLFRAAKEGAVFDFDGRKYVKKTK